MTELLQELWAAYQSGDYQSSLMRSAETLAGQAGIDLLHIAGLSLMKLNRHEEGVALLKAATTLRPQAPHIYVNAAFLTAEIGRIDDALYFVNNGFFDFPNNADLMLLKANTMVVQLKFREAQEIYQRLLDVNPEHVQSLINMGNIARAFDKFDEAEQYFARAEEVDPNFRDIAFARSTMYGQQGDNEKTIQALARVSDGDLDARFLLALAYLGKDDYERGFKLYRSRGESVWYRDNHFIHPLKPFDHWTEATNKNIAVIHEAGLGDGLQFVRYIPELAKISSKLTLYVPRTFERLYRYNLQNVQIVTKDFSYDDGPYDYITTDVEMAYHFRTTIDTIPDKTPYLFADPDVIDERRFPSTNKKLVGLCWAGGSRDMLNQRSYDERRSIQLSMLNKLNEIEDIQFVSLQMGEPAKQAWKHMWKPFNSDFDMMDSAAIISQLDLVITVDTSVVHLAGSLGIPTWLLSRYDGCWRWSHNRPDSAWYPGVVRVFGQQSYRDWSVPLRSVAKELARWVKQ